MRGIRGLGKTATAAERRKALKEFDALFESAPAKKKAGRRTAKAVKKTPVIFRGRKPASGRGTFCVMERTPAGTRSRCFSTQEAALNKFGQKSSALLYKRVFA
jgi:hypothetical protein